MELDGRGRERRGGGRGEEGRGGRGLNRVKLRDS